MQIAELGESKKNVAEEMQHTEEKNSHTSDSRHEECIVVRLRIEPFLEKSACLSMYQKGIVQLKRTGELSYAHVLFFLSSDY
jgi:hypothetical protein